MNWEEALDKFKEEMHQKFLLRESRHKDNSVTRTNVIDACPSYQWLLDYLYGEVEEHLKKPRDESEFIDIANLAMLCWWYRKEEEAQLQQLRQS